MAKREVADHWRSGETRGTWTEAKRRLRGEGGMLEMAMPPRRQQRNDNDDDHHSPTLWAWNGTAFIAFLLQKFTVMLCVCVRTDRHVCLEEQRKKETKESATHTYVRLTLANLLDHLAKLGNYVRTKTNWRMQIWIKFPF